VNHLPVLTSSLCLQCDCVVPVRPLADASSSVAAIRQAPYVPSPLAVSLVAMLNLCREYFGQLRQVTLQSLSQPVAQAISDRYAELRRNASGIEVRDLERSLSYARLFAISHGESEVSFTRWQTTYELEVARKARMSSLEGGGEDVKTA
jgi:Mini-chromosome maintenance replisome factor